MPNPNNNDALKTYFVSSIEQMTETLQKEISILVDDVAKKIDSRMEKIENEFIRSFTLYSWVEKLTCFAKPNPIRRGISNKK